MHHGDMNAFLAAAALCAFLVGLIHSVMGEMLIFSRMRQGSIIPTHGARLIGEGHVRILWASWHVLTVFGWLIAAALAWMSVSPWPAPVQLWTLRGIQVAMVMGALLVAVGTRGRHPGWVGLLAVAGFAWAGSSG